MPGFVPTEPALESKGPGLVTLSSLVQPTMTTHNDPCFKREEVDFVEV